MPNTPWQVFALMVSDSSFSQQPLRRTPSGFTLLMGTLRLREAKVMDPEKQSRDRNPGLSGAGWHCTENIAPDLWLLARPSL